MACEDYSESVAAYADGDASPEETARVEAHLASCPDCTDVVRSLRALRTTGAEHEAALFDDHPVADDLSRYAVLDPEIGTPRLAGIAAHVRSCPTCGHEADLTRRAVRAADGLWARLRPFVSPGTRLWIPAPVPAALAAAVVLLAIPAYQSLRQAPDSWSGGALPMILLERETRGATLPELTVDHRRPFTLMLVELDADAVPQDETLAVRLVDLDGREFWRHETDFSTAYDSDQGVVSLLVPTSTFRPGVLELELRLAGRENLRVVRFRVRE